MIHKHTLAEDSMRLPHGLAANLAEDGLLHVSGAGRARRGSLMVEMVICTILLSTVMLVLAPALVAVQQQRQAMRFDTLTIVELNNIAARLHTGTAVGPIELSAWFAQRYPDATLVVEPLDASEQDGPSPKPIRLTITRPSADGRPNVERLLVVWVRESGT